LPADRALKKQAGLILNPPLRLLLKFAFLANMASGQVPACRCRRRPLQSTLLVTGIEGADQCGEQKIGAHGARERMHARLCERPAAGEAEHLQGEEANVRLRLPNRADPGLGVPADNPENKQYAPGARREFPFVA